MSKVKPLPLFGDEPTPEQEAQPRKSRAKRDSAAATDIGEQEVIYPAANGLPILLVRSAEGDAAGVRSGVEFVQAAAERGWQGDEYAIGDLGSISGAQTSLYVAASAVSKDVQALLSGLLPLHTGEQVEVRGKREAVSPTALLLIAQEELGWVNVRKLAAKTALDLDSLHTYSAGLAVISLGWAATTLTGSKKEQQALNRALMTAKQACDGRLYLGVDASEAGEAERLRKQAAELGLPLIALHQADYIDEADAPIATALRTLQDIPAAASPRPLLSADQARTAFAALPDALANAVTLRANLATLPAAPLLPPAADNTLLQAQVERFDAAIVQLARDELAQVEAAGLSFAYQLASELAAYANEQGFEVRIGAGQGDDALALALGAEALPASLLPATELTPLSHSGGGGVGGGGKGRSLCLEYPNGRERQLLEYVAEKYAGYVCLLLPPPRTGLRLALREAAKASGASDADLARLLHLAREGEIASEGLSESEAALLSLAQRLVGRPRAGESASPSLLLTAQPLADSLPLEQVAPLPILRLSRSAASRLSAVRIDLTPSAALDLLDKAGGSLRDLPLDDEATLALLRAGKADDIETGAGLPAVESVTALIETLAAQMGTAAHDAIVRTLAWDNYRLVYIKAHQPQQYYAAVTGPLGLHPLAAHAEHWQAALTDARLFSSATLPPPGTSGRALGQLRSLRRLVAEDGSPFIAAHLQDLAGEINIFAYPPVNSTLATLGEGRLLLAYGTVLAANGQAALLVELVNAYEGGVIGPMPQPPTLPPLRRERGDSAPSDIFDAVGITLETAPAKPEPIQTERTNPATVNRASNGSAAPRGGGKDGSRQGNRGGSAHPAPPAPEPIWVRRLHLRLPVSDDEDADIDLMNQVANIAKRNVGSDLFLVYLRSGEYTVRVEPRGFAIDADAFRRAVGSLLGHDPVFDEDQVEIYQ